MDETKCMCGCNHEDEASMTEENENIIYLTMEDDSELECEILGTFDVDDQQYIALLPKDEENVILYQYCETESGEIQLDPVDEDKFDKVADVFDSLLSEEE